MNLVNVWLLAWLSIEWTHAIYQDQEIKGHLDPEWSEYIEKIDKEIQEIENSPPPPVLPVTSFYPRIDWSLVGNGEAPYLAVIFKETKQVKATLTPGNACGGALLTNDKIVTVCACLESWSTWVKQGGSLTKKSATNPYDIVSKRIYVLYGLNVFIPKLTTMLNNQEKSLWAANPCGTPSQLALVVKFKPRILHPIPQQYMPWPPVPVMETEESKHSKATAISFGMRARQPDKIFTTNFGEVISVEMRAVNFNLKHVPFSKCAEQLDWKSPAGSAICFSSTRDGAYEICDGLVGSPVTAGGVIHGLTMSPVSCKDGAEGELVTLPFDENIKNVMTGSADIKDADIGAYVDDTGANQVSYDDFLASEVASVRRRSLRSSRGTARVPLTPLLVAFAGCAYFFNN